jgi:outer membrane lipoprotein-sorting protein
MFQKKFIVAGALTLMVLSGCQQTDTPGGQTQISTSEASEETQAEELTLQESSAETDSNLENALKELDLVE